MAIVDVPAGVRLKQVEALEVPKEERGRKLTLRYRPPADPRARMHDEDGAEIRAYVVRIEKSGFAQIEYEDGTGHNVEILWV